MVFTTSEPLLLSTVLFPLLLLSPLGSPIFGSLLKSTPNKSVPLVSSPAIVVAATVACPTLLIASVICPMSAPAGKPNASLAASCITTVLISPRSGTPACPVTV